MRKKYSPPPPKRTVLIDENRAWIATITFYFTIILKKSFAADSKLGKTATFFSADINSITVLNELPFLSFRYLRKWVALRLFDLPSLFRRTVPPNCSIAPISSFRSLRLNPVRQELTPAPCGNRKRGKKVGDRAHVDAHPGPKRRGAIKYGG